MSRSLGDSIVHTVGGSSEPEITDYKLSPHDAFMIIASDGIWDVLDNNQVRTTHHPPGRQAGRAPGTIAGLVGGQ